MIIVYRKLNTELEERKSVRAIRKLLTIIALRGNQSSFFCPTFSSNSLTLHDMKQYINICEVGNK